MEPRIQYARTTDGANIAYWTMGSGPVPLLMSPPLGWSHISQELRVGPLRSWYERVGAGRMLVRYDPRGLGLSDRGLARLTEEDQIADVLAVIRHMAADRVDLFATLGPGGPMLRIAAEHPRMVRKLVAWSVNIDGGQFFGSSQMRAVRSLRDTDWVLFTETFSRALGGWSGDRPHAWAEFMRLSVDLRDAEIVLERLSQADWNPWLEKIRVPTLVVHDARVQQWDAHAHTSIPGAQLVSTAARHEIWHNEAGTSALVDFLDEGSPQPLSQLPSGTAIILFTDIAGSTALTERIGDADYRAASRALDENIRRAMREASGTPVEGKVLGDGVMGVFASAAQAIAAARACVVAAGDAELPLHIGLHAGDVLREDDNVYGGAVNIASRICGLCAPGEILVSQTVRDLARTSAGVTFEDRGEHALKGIADRVRIFAVRELA